MEPQVRYARTSDGVSIAYWSMGQGSPVVWIELPSQLQLEQKTFPDQARIYKAMFRLGTLVRYDHRGFGLSERNITKFPLDDLVKDLEAVVDKLAFEAFVLIAAGGFTGPVATAYAALPQQGRRSERTPDPLRANERRREHRLVRRRRGLALFLALITTRQHRRSLADARISRTHGKHRSSCNPCGL
jgi:pimeloyl-ACP methyl ester carboxylesterase